MNFHFHTIPLLHSVSRASTDAINDAPESVSWANLRSPSVFASLLDFVPEQTLRTLVPVAPHVAFFVHRRWRVLHRDESPPPPLRPSWRSIDSSASWCRLVAAQPPRQDVILNYTDENFSRALIAYADYLDGCASDSATLCTCVEYRLALARGMLNFGRWFCTLNKGCDCTGNVAALEAAYFGHLHVIQWALQNGLKRHPGFPAQAADAGNLRILKWLRRNDFPWDAQTCINAFDIRDERMLLWIHKGALDTWPCVNEPCGWARDHRANAFPQ
jgi:hypothetical protein